MKAAFVLFLNLVRPHPPPPGRCGPGPGLLVLFGCAVDCVVPAVVAAAVLENRRLPFAAARGQDGQERTVEWLRSVRGFAQVWAGVVGPVLWLLSGWSVAQQTHQASFV